MKNKNLDKYFTLFMFIFFLIISFLSPLMGDDWGNYINGSGGIISSIEYAINSYFDYEGRIISRILINILTYNKFIWNILNPLIISSIYYMILAITKHKDKYITPIILALAFLFVDVEAFRQIYVWLAGNITYLIPSILILIIVYLNKDLDIEKSNKFLYYLLPILTLFFSMFVESVSVGIIVAYVSYLIYYYIKKRKINKILLLSLILSIIGFVTMTFSPGNMLRLAEQVDFNKLNLFEKIFYNIPNFIKYTIMQNSFLIFLITLITVIFINKYIKSKILKCILYCYMIILPIMVACYYYLTTLGINISVLNVLLNSNNLYILLYFIIYFCIFLIFIIIYMLKEKDINSLIMLIIGLSCNLAMLLSPLWGGRTAYLTTICLSVSIIKILANQNYKIYKNKVLIIFAFIILLLISLFYLYGYINVYKDNIYREKSINYQKEETNSTIEIYVLSERFLWNPNPWDPDGYLSRTLKKYYNINSNTKIKMTTEKILIPNR